MPTKILEYGSAGLYSIASDLPITHEYIREGLNGSIVKPNDSDSIYECFVEIIQRLKIMIEKTLGNLFLKILVGTRNTKT